MTPLAIIPAAAMTVGADRKCFDVMRKSIEGIRKTIVGVPKGFKPDAKSDGVNRTWFDPIPKCTVPDAKSVDGSR